jgi:hypothetical protein
MLLSQFTRVFHARESVETVRSDRLAMWMAARSSITSKLTQLRQWKLPSTSI